MSEPKSEVEQGQLRRREAIVVFGIFIVYLILWLFIPKPAFWGLDGGIKYQGSQAYAKSGLLHVPYHGIDFDPEGVFRPMVFPFGVIHKDYQVPVFPAIFLMASGMFFWLLGKFGPFVMPLLGGFATIIAGWWMWADFRSRRDGRIYLLLLSFGTPLLFYSLTLWEHTWSMAFTLSAMVMLFRKRPRSSGTSPVFPYWQVLSAGLLLSLAVGFRTEAVLWMVVIAAFWKITERHWVALGWMSLGLLSGLVVIGSTNYWQTGEVLPLHLITNLEQSQDIGSIQILRARLVNVYLSLLTGFQSVVASLVGLIPLIVVIISEYWRKNRIAVYTILILVSIAWLTYFLTSLQSPNQISNTLRSGGLLWIIPFSILAFARFGENEHRIWRFLWVAGGAYILLYCLLSPLSQGIHWGPRFILTVVPFVVMLATIRAQRWWYYFKLTRPLILALAVFSIINQFYSFKLLYSASRENTQINEWVQSQNQDIALTSMWWFPGDCSVHAMDMEWYVTDSVDKIQTVTQNLKIRSARELVFYDTEPFISDELWPSLGLEQVNESIFEKQGKDLRATTLRFTN